MFKKGIVRRPGRSLIDGITTVDLGKPNYDEAINQHNQYVDALKKCGLDVIVLDEDENYPDGCFVEDTALLTEKCAIITNPMRESRRGEEKSIFEVLKKDYDNIETIKDPGTVEGGDIMRIRDHFYIGLSARTNEEGANQVINILEKYGYTGSVVPVKGVLHLKTGVTYIGNNTLVASGEFINEPAFKDFNIIKVDSKEDYCSNCIFINDYVLIPKGYEKTKAAILEKGHNIIELDMSEFKKIDGGLTCLSLRF